MEFLASSYLSLPESPGVYQFLNKNNHILYVGKAKNLKNRVSSYFSGSTFGKTASLVGQIEKIRIVQVESEIEALLLEANLIKKFSPKYNVKMTDGKAYPLIRITTEDAYPAVVTARRPDKEGSLYFGPYPQTKDMRTVLKLLRRIFPYKSDIHHGKKTCLYNHLGLCPCPEAFDSLEMKQDYKKTISHIVDFLEGKTTKVIKDLEKERASFAKKEQFEDAAKVQKQIDAIEKTIHPVHTPFEYETNPNLKEDLRMNEMISLQEILQASGVTLALPRRIECYDNSNFQGSNPTSSMVVLTNGHIDKSQYRKFKIKSVTGPNDFASMQEVLRRRLAHDKWPTPDLIIVDGGKGQISAASALLDSIGIDIPLVGLAKRDEIIITRDFKEIRLPKSSAALQLVMRIRDEAHRFAITFHRKLRSKATFS